VHRLDPPLAVSADDNFNPAISQRVEQRHVAFGQTLQQRRRRNIRVRIRAGAEHDCLRLDRREQRLAKRLAHARHGGHHNVAAQIQAAPDQVRLPRLAEVGEQQHTHAVYFAGKHRHVVVGLG
tara:strand:- start:263 stop:631 length:369 start_codon:yes stop_codon:yes gene_type:complete